jgi:hypothetical protein
MLAWPAGAAKHAACTHTVSGFVGPTAGKHSCGSEAANQRLVHANWLALFASEG